MARIKTETMVFEVPVNQPLSRVWNAMARHGQRTLLAAVPDIYSSIECLGGNWGEKGVTILFKYADGVYDFRYSNEIFEEVNHDNMFVKWRVVEGGPLGKYARWHVNSVKFLPGQDANSCIVRFSIEYESIGAQHDFYETYKANLIRAMKAANSYMNANPDYYCVPN